MKRFVATLILMSGMLYPLLAQNIVVDTLELDKGVSTSPALLLRGKLSGVRVSSIDNNDICGSFSVNIRGINSIRGNSEPLWIIDGAIMATDGGDNINAFWQDKYSDYGYMPGVSWLTGINLYDIESIQVLKNTSATAIYGSRGANGAIIINTKRPLEEKRSIEWNSNIGIRVPESEVAGVRTTFSHNHNLALGATAGRTLYRLSAFFRDDEGCIAGNAGKTGGLRIMFDTKANSVVNFGLNSALSLGKQYSQLSTSWYNTPTMVAGYSDKARIIRTTDSFYLNFNFLPWFKWKNNISVDYSASMRYIWFGEENDFGKEQNGVEGISYESLLDAEYATTFEFERYFAGSHHLLADIGGELAWRYGRMNTMNGANFFNKNMGYNSFNLRESEDNPAYMTKKYLTYSISGLARYDYKDFCGIDFSLRADYNNRYDDKFILYPASNIYVDIHNMLFRDSKSVSRLRIEAGYGIAGDLKYIPYKMFGNFTSGEYVKTDVATEAFFDGCRKLRSREYNAGLKTAFLDDRLELAVNWYRKTTDDNLFLFCFGEPKPSGIWKQTPRQTSCEQTSTILNTGIEADLTATIIRSGKFSWNISANFNYNHNEVLKLDANDAVGMYLNPIGTTANRNYTGSSLSLLYGFIHDSQGNIAGEGILGTTIPRYNYGIGTTLNYGDFTLDIQADGSAGFSILNMNRMFEDKVYSVSDIYVERGDYFRLSRVSLKYEIPVRAIDWIRSMSVNITGANLAVVSPYKGVCPDINSFGTSHLGNGIDYGGYPFARTIMIGIAAKF